jgi:GTPase SAR1 family protein
VNRKISGERNRVFFRERSLELWTTMTNLKLSSETSCTVVVVGDSRVGKTSLIQRFVQKTFQQVRHSAKHLFDTISFSLANRLPDNKMYVVLTMGADL